MSGSLLNNIGRVIYELGFQISPILFTGGIADMAPFGILPVIAITETGYDFGASGTALAAAGAIVTTAINALNTKSLDDFFAHFTPVQGGKLANYAIGMYPFANQSVAANAIISEPLTISLRMIIPVNKPGGHTAKLITMMALQSSIQAHVNKGGTFTIATPVNFYTNCILTGLTDVSQGSPIPQNAWQWDFIQPLVTLQQAQAAQNTFMSHTGSGLATPVPGNLPV